MTRHVHSGKSIVGVSIAVMAGADVSDQCSGVASTGAAADALICDSSAFLLLCASASFLSVALPVSI